MFFSSDMPFSSLSLSRLDFFFSLRSRLLLLFLSLLDIERLRLITSGDRVLDLRLSRDLECLEEDAKGAGFPLERDRLLLGDLDLRRDLDLFLDLERLLRLFLLERDLDLLDFDLLRFPLLRDLDLYRLLEGDLEEAFFVSAAAEISF